MTIDAENIRDTSSEEDDKFYDTELIADDSTKEVEIEEPQQQEHHGRFYRFLSRIGCGYAARFPKTWPRTFGLLFGVAGPIVLLIAIALLFGFFLAELEAPAEIEANNDIIAGRAQTAFVTSFYRNVSIEVPSICLELAARNQTNGAEFEKGVENSIAALFTQKARERFNESAEQVVNMEDLIEFTDQCGQEAWQKTEDFAEKVLIPDGSLGDLTFHWIRCTGSVGNGSTFDRIMGNYLRRPHTNLTSLRPEEQEALAVQDWTRDQNDLFNQYMKEFLEEGESPANAFALAKVRSLEDASGFGSCEANSDAGAWFWFTVMTTIGYGNTAPTTTGGRSMVYTIGFLSILTFGCVLASSGRIVTSIFDDWIDRVNFPLLHRKWAACLFWGSIYYGWMAVLARMTQHWKESRLGEEFEFRDAYWFSFITTTTVGLGDIYLEHQVLLRRDSIWFGLLILIGFIFLANFLVKLTEMATARFPHQWRNFETTLSETDMLWYTKEIQGKLLSMSHPAPKGDNTLAQESPMVEGGLREHNQM